MENQVVISKIEAELKASLVLLIEIGMMKAYQKKVD